MNFSFLLSQGSGRSQGGRFSQLGSTTRRSSSRLLRRSFFLFFRERGTAEPNFHTHTHTHTHTGGSILGEGTSFRRVRYLGDLWAGRWQVLSWDGRISVRRKKWCFLDNEEWKYPSFFSRVSSWAFALPVCCRWTTTCHILRLVDLFPRLAHQPSLDDSTTTAELS